MSKFINAVDIIDQVTDVIPIVSQIKNICIALYKLIHKVNRTANPCNTDWTTDIKIHVLSKSDFTIYVGFVPVIGNVFLLIKNIVQHKLQNYIATVILNSNPHTYEVVDLFLKRHQDIPADRAIANLKAAAGSSDKPLFSLIVNAQKWLEKDQEKLANGIISLIRYHQNWDNVKTILDSYITRFNDQQILDLFGHEYTFPIPEATGLKILDEYKSKIKPHLLNQILINFTRHPEYLNLIDKLITQIEISDETKKTALINSIAFYFIKPETQKQSAKVITTILKNCPGIEPDFFKDKQHNNYHWIIEDGSALNPLLSSIINSILNELSKQFTLCNYKQINVLDIIGTNFPNLECDKFSAILIVLAQIRIDLFKKILNNFNKITENDLAATIEIRSGLQAFYGKEHLKELDNAIKIKFPTIELPVWDDKLFEWFDSEFSSLKPVKQI